MAGCSVSACGTPSRHRMRPVSYTHLDVYKRQGFHTSVADMWKDPNLNLPAATDPAAPSGATIIDRDLKMNATWKSSLGGMFAGSGVCKRT